MILLFLESTGWQKSQALLAVAARANREECEFDSRQSEVYDVFKRMTVLDLKHPDVFPNLGYRSISCIFQNQ